MNIDDLFTDLVPYRPRIREEMPLLQWVEEFGNTSFLQIDVYTSKKAKENPNGFKASKVKSALINGFQSMTQEQRKLVQDTFSDTWISLALDVNEFRQLIVSTREIMEHARKNRGWKVDPLVRKIQVPKGAELTVGTEPTSETEVDPEPPKEPKSKTNKKKSRK